MEAEIPEVFLVLMVFRACGRKEMVVQNAADRPKTEIRFITGVLWA